MELVELVRLGDHPVLSFLNSTAMTAPDTVELIGDGRAYLAWLELAGLIDVADKEVAVRAFGPVELDAVAAEAIRLREWLRPVIAAWSAADSPALPRAASSHLNDILSLGHRFQQIETGDDGVARLRERRSWSDPRQLLVPPAEAAADLLTEADHKLVRHCEGPTCTLWFLDRTKSHRRRWCSMAACGNREKARKHRSQELRGSADTTKAPG